MAMLFINGQYHGDMVMEDIQDSSPCTWADSDTVYLLHNAKWWKATDRMAALGDRKGHAICYWDRVHPKLVPAELRLYELILK